MIFHIAVNSCQLFGQLDIDISTRYNAVFFTVKDRRHTVQQSFFWYDNDNKGDCVLAVPLYYYNTSSTENILNKSCFWTGHFEQHLVSLTILAIHELKTAKISSFWTFCRVILLILHSWIIGQNVQKLLVRAVFASCIASILNRVEKPAI